MKNNIPSYIGSITYSNGACKGHESEVLSFLCAAGYIPKKVMKLSKCEWRGEGYYCKEVMDAGYSIYGV